jgi:hypothetical protein
MEGYDRRGDRPPRAIFLIGMVYYPLTHSQAGGNILSTSWFARDRFDSNIIVRNYWSAGCRILLFFYIFMVLPVEKEVTTARDRDHHRPP